MTARTTALTKGFFCFAKATIGSLPARATAFTKGFFYFAKTTIGSLPALQLRSFAALALASALAPAPAGGGAACETGPVGPAPDPAFADDGLALVGFNIGGELNDSASAVTVQPDGRLLVGGFAQTDTKFRDKPALMRLLPDGQPDPDFGPDGDGRVVLNIVSSPDTANVSDIAVQPDGRIVAVGGLCQRAIVNGPCENNNLFFVRLHADGTFDTSFDFNGVRIINLGAREGASRLLVQPGGKLLGVGLADHSSEDETLACALLVRLNSDGSNDMEFGANGHVCHFSDGNPSIAIGRDLALLPDGRILVAGVATHGGTTPANNLDMAVLRLSPDGEPDVGFGDQGWSFVAFDQGGGFQDFASALTLDPAGRIVLAGSAQSVQSEDMAVARLLPDGTPDGSFGMDGRVLLPFDNDGEHDGSDSATGVSILNDGRILLGGTATRRHGSFDDFPPAGAAAVLHDDGSLDTCFGNGGRWVQVLPGRRDRGNFADLVLHGDRIYLAGSANVPEPSNSTGLRTDFMIAGFTVTGEIFSDRFEADD